MSLSSAEFEFVRNLVRERSAIVLDGGKEYLVESRLTPLAAREGYESIDGLVAALKKRTFGLDLKVIDAMTTNETAFFRDIDPWEILKTKVLPSLVERRRCERRLNIWCAAASTGQEPYTVAMLIREAIPDLDQWRVQFVATDISERVLDRARAGRYAQLEVNRGLPVRFLVKYFDQQGRDWVVKDQIRRMVDFRQLNLIERWPPMPAFDIVLIRNVLIYFDVDVKRQVLGGIHDLMSPDGYLFLGGAETTLGLDDRFQRVPYHRSGCYALDAGLRETAA